MGSGGNIPRGWEKEGEAEGKSTFRGGDFRGDPREGYEQNSHQPSGCVLSGPVVSADW